MTQSNKTVLWSHWIEKDDRPILNKLLSEFSNTQDLRAALIPYIDSIINTSIRVRQIIGASHSNKSIGKSTDKRLTTSFDLSAFLNQLSPENYLNDLKKKWDVKNDGPYSLYMELNFQLTLFKANQHNTPHALSLQLVDNTNEPLPINNLAETLLKSVHESLDELEDQEAQLILNLHFDGLLNEEISTLLGLPLLNIEQLLHVSKIALKEELKDKWGA